MYWQQMQRSKRNWNFIQGDCLSKGIKNFQPTNGGKIEVDSDIVQNKYPKIIDDVFSQRVILHNSNQLKFHMHCAYLTIVVFNIMYPLS